MTRQSFTCTSLSELTSLLASLVDLRQVIRMLTIPFKRAFLRPRRSRLVRRYFFVSVLLIGGGLIGSGLLEIYFRYHESQKQVATVQREMAAAAALKVEQFLQQIQNGMEAATINSVVAQHGLSPEYEFELKKLLSLVPSITELVAIDANGIPRLYVSRLRAGPWKVGEGIYSLSTFQQAKRGVSSFGPVYFKQDTEPYMTSMVPIKRFAGEVIGVLEAEVNLEHIWDTIARIKVGKAGNAYIVTERGDLIAHPDFNLVLRGAKMTQLQQVKAAFSTTREAYQPKEMVARDLGGGKVFTSYHLIPGTDWALFIEQPLKEAYEPVFASVLRPSSRGLVGLGVALVASFLVARRVVRPLESLRQGVERIGSGNLAYRIELKTGDEFEAVAEEFNKMATDLQESYTALEDKIADRTQELQTRTGELARSVEELKALGEVGRAVSSTLDLQTVLSTIVAHAVQLSATNGGIIYEYDEPTQEFHLRASYRMEQELVQAYRVTPLRLGQGATGRAAVTSEPVEITDLLQEQELPIRGIRPMLSRLGYRSLLSVPLLLEKRIMGALTVFRREVGSFSPDVVNLLRTFAAQSALAIQNARLFREIEDKSRQIKAANRHKSEFVANLSHELRTPLNAIIGFSEVLSERMFGELNEKQAEYTDDILSSGRHLLSLINEILDLSKVEAGRMELEVATFDLPTAIENALILIRERATRHGIKVEHKIDERLGEVVGDERKFKQILLNLLSNAVKFTPEGGSIGVSAALTKEAVEVAVSDTGIGIARENQETIFEEFRQVGTDASKKREGTGLGLTLTKKFVELHGGTIRVESAVGKGSTFTFTLPLNQENFDGARTHPDH